ncbi:hypothetical protein J596_3650 [Acinetobacter baumannii 21072]|uniref:Uncharacterized protein n=1 Tax=Acinetobacter baumannii 21072 TaxID=1310697 RepID=A0A062HZU4_ACIBA|nr:hypothetical protein J596_3650 [Acinetobacter baumannii 21072]
MELQDIYRLKSDILKILETTPNQNHFILFKCFCFTNAKIKRTSK